MPLDMLSSFVLTVFAADDIDDDSAIVGGQDWRVGLRLQLLLMRGRFH
jgi:hypothetical protein